MSKLDRTSGRPFFIIWNHMSDKPPTQCFKRRADAEKVAQDLTKKTGQDFYVCKALSLTVSQPVTLDLNPKANNSKPLPDCLDWLALLSVKQ